MKKKEKAAMHATTGMYDFRNTEAKPIVVDPLGSYTGRADDPFEVPVQDADDL